MDYTNDLFYFSENTIKEYYSYNRGNNDIIPLDLYQTYRTKKMPYNMSRNLAYNIRNNPDLEFHLYDDNDCREFIKNNFNDIVLYAFDKLKPGAYKADLWRLCILFLKGGFYMDIKMKTVKGFNLSQLNSKEHLVLDMPLKLPDQKPITGIYNAFMITKKFNPFVKECIKNICINVLNLYVGNHPLSVTGPLFMKSIFDNMENDTNIFDLSHHREPKKYEKQCMSERLGIVILNDEPILICEYLGYFKDRQMIYEMYDTHHYAHLWKKNNIYNNNLNIIIDSEDNIINFIDNKLIICNNKSNSNIVRDDKSTILYKSNNKLGVLSGFRYDSVSIENINYVFSIRYAINICNKILNITHYEDDDNSESEDYIYNFKLKKLLNEWIQKTALEIRNIDIIESDHESDHESDEEDTYKNNDNIVDEELLRHYSSVISKLKFKSIIRNYQNHSSKKSQTIVEKYHKSSFKKPSLLKNNDNIVDEELLRHFRSVISKSSFKKPSLLKNNTNSKKTNTDYKSYNIISQLYKEILLRNPDDDGLQYWVEKYNNGMSIEAIKYIMVNSKEGKKLQRKKEKFLTYSSQVRQTMTVPNYLFTLNY